MWDKRALLGADPVPGAASPGATVTRRLFLRRGLLLGGLLGLSGVLSACTPSQPQAPPPAAKPTEAPKPAAPAATPAAPAAAPAASPAAAPAAKVAASPAAAPAVAKPTQLTKVSFRLNFNPNAEHAPYYLGKKKGFYRDQGVDLDILPGTGSAVAVKLVGTGDSNFGVAVSDTVTVGRSQTIPVVATAVLLQQSPTVLVSKKEKNITKPTDLYGKKVGVNPQSTVYAFWQAFKKVNNLDVSQIEEINVTGSALAPFVAGTFDAVGLLLTNEVVTLQNQGQALNIMNYGEYGVKSYGQVVFTSDNYLKDNRDVAGRLTAATLKSWEYTLANVDEAIDALAEVVPETDKALEKAKWGPISQLVRAPGGQQVPLGTQTLEGWQNTYQTFKTGGVIEQDFDVKTLFVTL